MTALSIGPPRGLVWLCAFTSLGMDRDYLSTIIRTLEMLITGKNIQREQNRY